MESGFVFSQENAMMAPRGDGMELAVFDRLVNIQGRVEKGFGELKMHEMSLAEGVLQIMEDQAQSQQFKQVKTVWLEIGELSHVSPEAITFCFDAVTKGSLADGAKLEIIRTPGQAWCHECAEQVAVSSLADPCPKCNGHKIQVTDGDDMRVKELEVD